MDQYGQNYAVKQLTFSSNKPEEIAIAQSKFNDEKEILQKLQAHQQIPDFVDYIAENQQYYLGIWISKIAISEYLLPIFFV